MNYLLRYALVSVAVAGLAGCKIPGLHSHAAPTGQVAATVNGHEITLRDVGVELNNFTTSDPKIRKAAQTAALDNIVSRKILAQAASDQGLDKTPDFAVLKDRATDTLLAQLLEQKIAKQVPSPTQEEADAFVTEHPNMFSQRKIYIVDQLRMARPADASVLKALQPLKTLAEVGAQLDQDHLAYEKGVATLDALGADPNMIDQINKLPPGEIFIIPSGGQLLVNQIRDTQIVPFGGAPASRFAMAYLKRQRTQQAVRRQLSAIVGKALAEVRFNKDYAPVKRSPAPASAGPKAE